MSIMHVQFSGSLQIEDGEAVVELLKAAIERRPADCGSYLRAEVIDRATIEDGTITLSINELRDAIVPGEMGPAE